jgi:large subunit ribosomal protein L23
MFSRINRGFRMFMPTMPMTLVNATNATETRAATAMFRVLPRMTKHEIKEYLTKLYDLPVSKVRTMNYMGKRKRATGKRKVIYYKYRDFKKAVVTFDDSIQDLGLGARIPELEELERQQEEA